MMEMTILKRSILSIATLSVGVFSYTQLYAPHSFAATEQLRAQQGTKQTNKQLQDQLTALAKQIQSLEVQVKTAQAGDAQAQANLKSSEHEAANLQTQLAAKQARAAQVALEQQLAAQQLSQIATPSSAPQVQTVTRASGHGDDGGSDSGGSGHDD